MLRDRLQRFVESEAGHAGCVIAIVLAAHSLRWLSDLVSPWHIGDDLSLLYIVSSLVAAPAVGLTLLVCVRRRIDYNL